MEIVVRHYGEVEAALREAAASGAAVTLWNAPDTAAFAGFMYVRAMFDLARTCVPEAKAAFAFDAGEDAPAAIAAMQSGFRTIRYSGPEQVLRKLRDMARQYGTAVAGKEDGPKITDRDTA